VPSDRTAAASLSDYVHLAWQSRWTLLVAGVLCGALAFAITFAIPETFRATTSVIPAARGQGLGTIGGLAGFLGTNLSELGIGSAPTPVDPVMYGEIVRSRRLFQRLLEGPVPGTGGNEAGQLIDVIQPSGSGELRLQRALRKLRQCVDVRLDRRTGILTIEAKAKDPGTAAGMANTLCDFLQEYVLTTLTTQAGQNRRFIEERLTETKAVLVRSEDELRAFRERNVRIGNSPRLSLEEGRLIRTLREQEEIFLTLRRQFELARIEERRDVPALNVLDVAMPPVTREWPKRKLIMLAGIVLGMGVAFAVRVSRVTPASWGRLRKS